MKSIDRETGVNRVSEFIDGTKVTVLTGLLPKTTIDALSYLDEANENVQTLNSWNFHAVYDQRASADVNDEISIPGNWLALTLVSWTGGSIADLSVDSGKIYNQRTGTFAVGGNIVYEGTRYYDFEELPLSMQKLVVAEAKKLASEVNTHMSPNKIQIAQGEVNAARVAALKWDDQFKNRRLTQQHPRLPRRNYQGRTR